jgi:hypothetical protein
MQIERKLKKDLEISLTEIDSYSESKAVELDLQTKIDIKEIEESARRMKESCDRLMAAFESTAKIIENLIGLMKDINADKK